MTIDTASYMGNLGKAVKHPSCHLVKFIQGGYKLCTCMCVYIPGFKWHDMEHGPFGTDSQDSKVGSERLAVSHGTPAAFAASPGSEGPSWGVVLVHRLTSLPI